eukprot:2454342-Prymnesium_polylepis.1
MPHFFRPLRGLPTSRQSLRLRRAVPLNRSRRSLRPRCAALFTRSMRANRTPSRLELRVRSLPATDGFDEEAATTAKGRKKVVGGKQIDNGIRRL